MARSRRGRRSGRRSSRGRRMMSVTLGGRRR